jgi:hypothetical protein
MKEAFMQIKIGNKIYTAENKPIMIILEPQDIENIRNMVEGANRYCIYPTDKFTEEEIKKWMVEDVEENDGTGT